MSDDGLTTLEVSRLETSERCCRLFVERGATDLTVAEIAVAVGVSQRTFHRYFPTKADSVGPLFDAAIRRSNRVIVEAAAELELTEVLLVAFRASLLGESADRTLRLFPLVFRDPEMWAVFMRKLHDGERLVAPILAPRIGLSVGSVAARAAAASVASAMRIALETMVMTGAELETIYASTLDAFVAGPLGRR